MSSTPSTVVYTFSVIIAQSQDQANEAKRQRGWTPEQDARSPIWSVNIGDLGWCRGPEHDQGDYTLVQLVRQTANGLQSTQGKGYIPRACIELGKQMATNGLGIDGAVPSKKQIINPPGPQQVSGKFTSFTKALFTNFGNEKDTFIRLGFAPKDIEWMTSTDDLIHLLHKGTCLINTKWHCVSMSLVETTPSFSFMCEAQRAAKSLFFCDR